MGTSRPLLDLRPIGRLEPMPGEGGQGGEGSISKGAHLLALDVLQRQSIHPLGRGLQGVIPVTQTTETTWKGKA